ncbi:MAG: antitoxin MazE family protein [bacterium]|nr:antitoxin MazE family protein [bacterium]
MLDDLTGKTMSPDTQNMEKHRAALRAQDLRPIQVWVPDTRAPDCADECARRAAIVNEANCADPELVPFMDATAAELLDTLEAGHQE